MANVVTIVGRLARPAAVRELPSGDRLVTYEVTVDRAPERAETVPVVWFSPSGGGADHDVGELVIVVGRVRRRFFRAGGSTQSRTEVVAERVVPLRHGLRAHEALAWARTETQKALAAVAVVSR